MFRCAEALGVSRFAPRWFALVVAVAGCKTTIRPSDVAQYDFATQSLPWCSKAQHQQRDLAAHETQSLPPRASERTAVEGRRGQIAEGPFVRCSQRMLLENDTFWERVVVVVDFETDDAGRVSSLCVAYGPRHMPETADCVGDVVRQLDFPPTLSSRYVVKFVVER